MERKKKSEFQKLRVNRKLIGDRDRLHGKTRYLRELFLLFGKECRIPVVVVVEVVVVRVGGIRGLATPQTSAAADPGTARWRTTSGFTISNFAGTAWSGATPLTTLAIA